MKTVFIGEVIRQRRKELGFSQEQLCDGICDPVSISRIENGKQTPSKMVMDALLERLGLPAGKYYAFLNKKEETIDNLQKEIISANVFKDSKRGLEKIAELEKFADADDPLVNQFILRSKVLLGKEEDGEIKPYDFEEKLDLLMKAIRLTVPKFDIEEINKGLYSLDEVKIINQIATIYSDNEQHFKAIEIHQQLLRYIKKHFENILQSGGLLPLVAYNYARELDLIGRYKEAIEIAELGWDSCVKYGQYRTLPSTIALMAECYHFLGDDEKSKDYYKQAYYMHKAIGNDNSLKVVKSEVKKYFGSDFTF